MSAHSAPQTHPVIARLQDFDARSGSLVERAVFNHRLLVLLICLAGTILLAWQAQGIRLNASFEKTIPTGHPYIANYLQNRQDLGALGNSMRVAVETAEGTIFDKQYLDVLQKINDEIYLLPGVDRPFMKSLWTTSTRWAAVTEEGLDGGTVISDAYDGSQASLDQVRANVERSGEIGQLVAANFRSSVIVVPLLDKDPQTGQPLDYRSLAASVEQIRAKYQQGKIRIHVTGFAKVIGDLIDGLHQVLLFFLAAVLIASAMLYWYTRCPRSTLLVVACSLVALVWQLGLIKLAGYELDPYSVLVPFLVFAIGMSHGAQKMNGIMQDIGRGTHRVVAARYTFRRLFLAGLTALLCDAVGFAVLMIIQIKVIQDLALIASIGVAVLIFTNLILLPILLSYTGVTPAAALRSLNDEVQDSKGGKHPLWAFLDRFTGRAWAAGAIALSLAMALAGYAVSLKLQVGDLDPGAPELRADSRYNLDNAFMVKNYAASSDILVVMVKTADDACTRYPSLAKVDELAWQLEQLPGVEATNSMASLSRIAAAGYNEGNFKWIDLIPNDDVLSGVRNRAPRELFNQSCNLTTLFVYLKDHKAATLTRVVDAVEAYARANTTPDTRFLLTAGSAGIEAATNIVVKKASRDMMYWVYGAVILLCWITFRSWRAVIVAVLPLMLTSILCEALMVGFGMGVKVATLPVIALGVGIGVDYALYVLSVMLARLRQGESLSAAYYHALLFTGKVVMLTGVTLAIGVATWAFSPIKFQADMGILLAFMFVWNMVGALILLPALACFLLKPAVRPQALAGGATPSPVPFTERHNMHWKLRLKANATRFIFNRIVMRKAAYRIDGVPASFHDEEHFIPTPQGEARTLFHWPPARAKDGRGLPAVILFHGGGFVFGLPEHEAAFCRRLASNLGCVVINPDYVLAPEHPFPQAAHQSYELAAWVAREAGRLGIDPERIAIGGHSAGGNLATVVIAQALRKGFPTFCYQILDYPFLDGTVAPSDKPRPIPNPVITPQLATLFNSCYMPEGTDTRDPLLSPVCSDVASLASHPPTLVITAQYDVLRDEADRYAGMLRSAGVQVRHEVFADVDHAFTHSGPKAAADRAWELIEQCLGAAFARTGQEAA